MEVKLRFRPKKISGDGVWGCKVSRRIEGSTSSDMGTKRTLIFAEEKEEREKREKKLKAKKSMMEIGRENQAEDWAEAAAAEEFRRYTDQIQSVALERARLAVNKKGLPLRELLQQTSHHNAKIRKSALTGIKDLVVKHPSELKLHKLVVIEKLRERICDADKVVQEKLYQLLKNDIFPCIKEDTIGPIISLMMAYVFNAMTHMAVDIRLMAFKFFNLVVKSFPSSFIQYAEKARPGQVFQGL